MNKTNNSQLNWIQHPVDIAILIVNYHTKEYIKKLLESFQKYETYSGKVTFYIGDNASWDDLSSIPEIFPNLSIEVFQFSGNKGFGAWNNALASHTKETVLFLVNPDVSWTSPVIGRLIESLDDPKRAVVGPKLCLPDGSPQWWDHGELSGIFTRVARIIGSSFWKNQTQPIDVAWISGAAFMIKSDVFRNVDGFDENFFLYREEEDLCIRIRKKWQEIYYIPSVSMVHIGSVVAWKSKYMDESHNLYLKKHHPFIYKTGISSRLNRIFWKLYDRWTKFQNQ